ncbi:amp-binding protein [Plasmopara halstedii]|uniref:Amp-binding protein n=1 Tax=Plasmopara halstedii TaxID=4781 RepID=A0A0P1ANR5_PLAHL|nr:amp-binding protein [Plasmopara halstedii]CEG42636.1 amp-binding protein [Plasmopara halstedii]|eukprot:XP_024579005.1 amp-binding protein [Plasmopara halstedii]
MLGLVHSKRLVRIPLCFRAASTVGATLDEAVNRLPHKEALRSIKQDVRWSFKELNTVVSELANGFLDLQFRCGDVVALWLPNNVENVVTQLAAARAGLTLALIEPQVSEAEELAYILQDSEASGLIFEPKHAGRNQTKIVQDLFPELATFRQRKEVFRPKNFRHLHTVITTGWDPVEGMLNLNGMMVNSPEPHILKAVSKMLNEKTPLVFTYSQTKGQNPKKSALLTHGDLLQRAEMLATSLKLTATDKVLLTGEEPGLSSGPLAAISQSAQIVLPSTEFDQEAIQQAMKVEQCSILGSGLENFKRV